MFPAADLKEFFGLWYLYAWTYLPTQREESGEITFAKAWILMDFVHYWIPTDLQSI